MEKKSSSEADETNLFDEFCFENLGDEHFPYICELVEIEESRKKAFEHLMKTKLLHDERISDEILEQINQKTFRERKWKNYGSSIL
jgi:hypothetical protein